MTSLRVKLTLLIAIVSAFCSVLSVTLITAQHSQREAIERAAAALSDEARLVAMRIEDSLELPRRDIRMLVGTPPIEGIMRAEANAGLDPYDGSFTSQWTDRLSDIFRALMRTRDGYFQIRLVSLGPNGREIVRVERVDGALVRTPEGELQEKADEPYYDEALTLEPGQVRVGEVTFNRENGVRDPRGLRAVRIFTPIHDADGEPFAFLIINADHHELLREALQRIEPRHNVLLLYGDGDYGLARVEAHLNTIRVGHVEAPPAPPAALDLLKANGDRPYFTSGENLFGVYVRHIDDGPPMRAMSWSEMTDVVAPVRAAVLEASLLALGFALIATLIGGLAASRLTANLRSLARAVSEHDLRSPTLVLRRPAGRDETGDLARAFGDLIMRLSASEMKAQAVLNDLMEAVVVIDENGRIEEFSRAAERLFGYSEQEAIGSNVNILMPQAERTEHDRSLERYRRTGVKRMIGNRREVIAMRRDGRPFPADLAISEIRVGRRRVFSAVIRDASLRREQKRTDEFISTMNHELRTPLTSVKASLAMLQQSAGEGLDTRSARLLELARKGCDRLMQIVNDMLDIEKVRQGKMEFRLEVADLRALAQEAADRVRALAEEKQVSVELDLAAIPCPAAVDPLRFSQALGNILNNALRHSPDGARVELRVARVDAGLLRVTVRDHGPGIPEAFRAKVFQRFAQAETHGGGSGLGLSISRGLIRAFGGDIWFESQEGAGAAFHMELPLHGAHSRETSVG